MDKDKFVREIETLLHDNGAIKEIKTKLRSELVQILLNKKQLQVTKEVTDRDKAVNLLILEHLMQNGLWYSASILASEAEFIEPPPEIETVLTSNAGSFKRHTPAKFSHSTLNNLTRVLDNSLLNSEMKQLEGKYQQGRNLSYLSLCLNLSPPQSSRGRRGEMLKNSEQEEYSTTSNNQEIDLKMEKMTKQTNHLHSIIQHQKMQIEELQHKLSMMEDSNLLKNNPAASTSKTEINNAEAIPRHDVGDVKSYLTGVKFYLQEMENENEKVVKEYQTILNQFHSDTQQNQ